MDFIITVFLIATVTTSSLHADATSQQNFQHLLNYLPLSGVTSPDRPLPLNRANLPEADRSSLKASEASGKSPSGRFDQRPSSSLNRPGSQQESEEEMGRHLTQLQRLLLDIIISMRTGTDLSRKRSWPQNNIHTRLAPFGTKLVPNRNALGNGGATLFRYGRAV